MKTNTESLRECIETLEIMLHQLEAAHDKAGYVDTNSFVGIDANLGNVKAAINDLKKATQHHTASSGMVEAVTPNGRTVYEIYREMINARFLHGEPQALGSQRIKVLADAIEKRLGEAKCKS